MKIKISQLKRMIAEETRRLNEESPDDIINGLASLDSLFDQFLSKMRDFRRIAGPDDEFNKLADDAQFLGRKVKRYVKANS